MEAKLGRVWLLWGASAETISGSPSRERKGQRTSSLRFSEKPGFFLPPDPTPGSAGEIMGGVPGGVPPRVSKPDLLLGESVSGVPTRETSIELPACRVGESSCPGCEAVGTSGAE